MPSHDFETQIHLRSAQSNGAVSVVELAASPEFAGPPLHHHDFDEAFYVLEGELTFQLGDELRTAGPGELVFAPRGSHHTLANLSGAPARYLVVCTPAGFENRFARTAAERAGLEPPDWALEPYPETTFVGPRIGEREDA
ncbi:MAG TPA: cupin domain-containing protein [Solirubrobacteraceae bacterium]|jgi:quercetin dioxygenase-like cupin family protein|nr:cupin domain-containing protein [Solirubrobacteraceae bacterium]